MTSYALHNEAIINNYKFMHYDVIESTNDAAYAIANDKQDSKYWVVADRQTAGRGRRGRNWKSPQGNLYTSLLLYDEIAFKDVNALSYIAGVSLLDTINNFATLYNIPSLDIGLKWPNDVMLSGKKLAGILVETKSTLDENLAVVIGMGVNIATKIAVPQYATSCLHEASISCSSAEFFTSLTYYWLHNYNAFKDKGNLVIRNKWLSYCCSIGKEITLTTENQVRFGVFEGIDENFNCLLRLSDNNLLKVTTGDIVVKI